MAKVKIIRKHKDYSSVEEAQMFYEKQRLHELSAHNFGVQYYPERFEYWVKKLAKFQNPVQMNVWHNPNAKVVDADGNLIVNTWDNICTFKRPFILAEMLQVVEIIKRATPNELFDFDNCKELYESGNLSLGIRKELEEDSYEVTWDILAYFNEIAFPELKFIAKEIEEALYYMEEQLCAPIRLKINADLKIMHQLPVGSNVEFIKAKERRM